MKTVCRIFDPLGFLAPYVVRGKQIMQDIWLSGVDWDENVREAEKLNFERWFEELKHLDKIKISRCLKNENNETRLKSMSIHTFVHASSIAYGAVTYLRCEYKKLGCDCTLCSCKTSCYSHRIY